MRRRDIIDVVDPMRPHLAEVAIAMSPAAIPDLSSFHALQHQTLDHLYSLTEPTPASIFHQAFRASQANPVKSRRWKARALNLNPDDPHMAIALNGMAPLHHDGKWQMAIAYPAPAPIDGGTDSIDEIVLIDPADGNAGLYDDVGDFIIGGDEESFTVHADARVWAREQATARVEWFYAVQQARAASNVALPWNRKPTSALAIGDVRKIRWPSATQITAGTGIDAKTLRSALFRQARIPHVHDALQGVAA